MPTENEISKGMGEAFKKVGTGILLLGVLLMIASMYINTIKEGFGNLGLFYSQVIIIFALIIKLVFSIISVAKKLQELEKKD